MSFAKEIKSCNQAELTCFDIDRLVEWINKQIEIKEAELHVLDLKDADRGEWLECAGEKKGYKQVLAHIKYMKVY